MRVSHAGTIPGDPYPQLRLIVDGAEVLLAPDQQKRAILDAGYVYLGPDFEATLPPVNFAVDGRAETLRGFTDHADVVRHFREFLARIA
jgi:hypothetical protein